MAINKTTAANRIQAVLDEITPPEKGKLVVVVGYLNSTFQSVNLMTLNEADAMSIMKCVDEANANQ